MDLLQTKAGMSCADVLSRDAPTSRIREALTENMALLELLYALGDGRELCFWKNEKGRAEVDFVVNLGGGNIPIEVKSGEFGRIHGLETYCSRYGPDLAVVASRRNVRSPEGGGWMFLPLCLLWRLRDYVEATHRKVRD